MTGRSSRCERLRFPSDSDFGQRQGRFPEHERPDAFGGNGIGYGEPGVQASCNGTDQEWDKGLYNRFRDDPELG